MVKKIRCESCNKLLAEVAVEADITATQHFSNPVGKIINCGRCSGFYKRRERPFFGNSSDTLRATFFR